MSSRITKAAQLLEQDFEREPTVEEISEFLDMEIEEVSSSLNFNNKHVSLDSPLGEDGDGTMVDIMENDNADPTDLESQQSSMHYEIELALNSLPEKQRKVLQCLYGIGMDRPMGMEDIGEQFNLTRERVRQIRDQALMTLRRQHQTTRLRAFL
jgi:RNA polymerase primary sigma factor